MTGILRQMKILKHTFTFVNEMTQTPVINKRLLIHTYTKLMVVHIRTKFTLLRYTLLQL